ncbi:MAG: hypothetical protein KZQ82_19080 [Candidatus Thiodiazotropha sp. (ex Lucinoma annulata)]|nr:hypothetical protein [Candidatus Thiodiazotropha sp. (ex Lucinoma annulata)]
MDSLIKRLFALLFVLQGCGDGTGDTDGDTVLQDESITGEWSWRNPLPQGNSLSYVEWNGEIAVAVGSNGTIFTSMDRSNWIEQDSGTLHNFRSVIWTGTQFVAVGGTDAHLGMVAISQDGIDWNIQDTELNSIPNDIAWNGTQLVAVGRDEIVATSLDGINWSQQTVSLYDSNYEIYSSIIWTGQRFVAVGSIGSFSSTGSVMTSEDGIHWSWPDLPPLLTPHGRPSFLDVVWADNQVVAVGQWGLIATSPNGITWTIIESDITETALSVTWNGSKLILTTDTDAIYTSDDGVTWVKHSWGATAPLFDSTWTGSEFVAVGAGGALVSSTDGENWLAASQSASYKGLKDVVWNGSQYIAVGREGEVLSSLDGIVWTGENSGTDLEINRVIWAGEQFYAVGYAGLIISSPDGSSWTTHDSGLDTWDILNDIAWSGSRYVAVAGNTIVISDDGLEWVNVEHSDFYMFQIESIVWSGSEFVAVGSESPVTGQVISSPDGVNWTVNAISVDNEQGFGNVLSDISYNGDQYLMLSSREASNIYSSKDGVNWVLYEHGMVRGLQHVQWTGSQYFAVGQGLIASSEDGVTWREESTLTNLMLQGIASSENQVIVVGPVGSIISLD